MSGYTFSRVMPGTPGVTWLNGQMSGCSGYGGNTCCSPPESACGYTAVTGEGCAGYIHMDDAATYGIQGGSWTVEECATAVQALNGQSGCMGDYFFFESAGYCNCPRDACTTGSENSNAGGTGQLYRFNSDCAPPPPTLTPMPPPTPGLTVTPHYGMTCSSPAPWSAVSSEISGLASPLAFPSGGGCVRFNGGHDS